MTGAQTAVEPWYPTGYQLLFLATDWVNETTRQFHRLRDADAVCLISAVTLVDVFQATSQMTDESGQSYPFTIDTLLDRALGDGRLLWRLYD